MKLLLLTIVVAFSATYAEVKSSTFHQHVSSFADEFSKYLAAEPKGTYDDMVDVVEKKYKDAKSALMAARPTGRPVGGHKGRKQHNNAKWALTKQWVQAKAALRKYYADVMRKEKEAKKQAAAAADSDETEILSSPFAVHAESFRKHFDGLLANRPTGRPDFDKYYDMLDKKYGEAKNNLKALKSNDKGQKTAYKQARKQLKGHKEDIEDQLDQWEDDVRNQEVLNSVFGKHISDFNNHFSNAFAGRPTGRPKQVNQFFKDLRQKYNEYKNKLKSAKPDKKASKADKDLFDDAYDQLKDNWDDAKDKVEAWAKQLKKQQKAKNQAAKTTAVEN